MKQWIAGAAVAVMTVLACHAAEPDAALKAAVAGTQRTPENAARDGWRHPVETLGFFGIRPDQTVVELVPGGGWYTEILAPYLRDHGRLIVAGADPQSPGGLRQKQRFDANPAVYGRVQVGMLDAKNGRFDFGASGSADMVLTFRNTHNWVDLGEAQTRAVYQAAFDALKSGGVLGVTDHRLPESRPQDAQASTGYLHQSFVVKVAESVGFRFAGSSEINANPKDDADHENGVWALPPTYANKDKDRAKYQAIGESDRMTLKFVKP